MLVAHSIDVSPATSADPTGHHVLDNLIWHSLTTTHAHLAQGDGVARRYHPDVAAFAAIERSDDAGWAALADLIGPGESLLVSGPLGIEPPADWERLGGGAGYQMVLGDLVDVPIPDGVITRLRAEHVPQMMALVEIAQPGPFRKRTIELGEYLGVFEDGELIAMAGERLQTPAFTEVSAVCTHPSARGRGWAAALSHRVATGILARGQTPLLHVRKSNEPARRVYERLGFSIRMETDFLALRTPA
jgi:ribosomal protein S18 acetylase RimI-like enzyme